MTSHDDFTERLGRYLEGELAPDEARQVEDHLASCEECRKERERLRDTVRVLGRMKGTQAPDGFVDAVQGRIRRRSRGRFFARRPDFTTRLPYELLSVIMLVAIIAIFLYVFLGRGGGAAIPH